MKKIFCSAICCFILVLMSHPHDVLAHDPPPFVGYTVSAFGAGFPEDGMGGAGVDLNVYLLYLNFGLTCQAWSGEVQGWDGEQHKNDISVQAGIGLLNFFQIQGAFSESGSRLRVRAEIPLYKRKDYSAFMKKPGEETTPFQDAISVLSVWDTIVVIPVIETNFDVTSYSLGVGFVF